MGISMVWWRTKCVKTKSKYNIKNIHAKIPLIFNSFKLSHIIDLGLNNKISYINHEYAIDSYVCLYAIVHQ
jgi:hypothetical protein